MWSVYTDIKVSQYRVPAYHWSHLHGRVHSVGGPSHDSVLHDKEAVRVEDEGDRAEDERVRTGGPPVSPRSGRVGDGQGQRRHEQEVRGGGIWNGVRRGTLSGGQPVGINAIIFYSNKCPLLYLLVWAPNTWMLYQICMNIAESKDQIWKICLLIK